MTGHRYAGRPIHFPFIEGQFSARDCHACGERCCRHTAGLVLGASQSGLLDSLGGPHAVQARDAGAIYVDTSGGCPALRSDGLCSLHAEHGLRGKPALCALFPYVALSDHGDFLSLAPNISYVCPLSAEVPLGDARHPFSEILADLEYFFPKGSAPTAPLPVHRQSPVALETERHIVEVAQQMRGRGDHIDVLVEVRGTGIRAELAEHRAHLRASLPSLPRGGATAFYGRALPLMGILRTWLFGHPLPIVDRATDIALRLLYKQLRRGIADRQDTELQRMARTLQRDLARCVRLAQS